MEISAEAMSGDNGSKTPVSSVASGYEKDARDVLPEGFGMGSKRWLGCESIEAEGEGDCAGLDDAVDGSGSGAESNGDRGGSSS